MNNLKKSQEIMTASEKTVVSIDRLAKVAIWLDGYVAGKGDFLPLGTIDLINVWNAVKYLQGDNRFHLLESEEKTT